MRRAFLLRSTLLFLGVALTVGCASSRSTEDDAAARAAAIGTWEYEVNGTAPLEAGVFRIAEQRGRLQALVQDQRRGRFRARADVSGSRLELSIDDLHISGRIDDDQFTAFLRRDQWDVSTTQRPRRHARSSFRSASLYARRIRSASAVSRPSILECESILWETNGCN